MTTSAPLLPLVSRASSVLRRRRMVAPADVNVVFRPPADARAAAPPCTTCVVPRLLIVPGLHDSGPMHWQSWLQRRHRSSVRVAVRDWSRPELDAWAVDIASTLNAQPPGPWIAVAHSFGCLAVLRHLQHRSQLRRRGHAGIFAALLVAPADPERHRLDGLLRARADEAELMIVSSSNDPWLPTDAALPWAAAWGARLQDLGDAGHINAESGFGPWPQSNELVLRMRQRWHARHHAAATETAVLAHAA